MTNEITEALGTVGTTLTSSINPGMVVAVIATVLGASIGIYLVIFGVKKLVSGVKKALHGRLSI